MLSTTHLVSGAAIGIVSSSYLEVILFSILFHFLLDLLPHWDPDFSKDRRFFLIASFDLLFGLLLCFFLAGEKLDFKILLAMACSILPDVVNFLVLVSKRKPGMVYVNWHKLIQNNRNDWGGILSQVIVIVVMIIVIITF